MIRTSSFLIFLIISVVAFSQDKEDIRDFIPTENTAMGMDANRKENRGSLKRYAVIYRPNAEKILYGNPCALEATRKMGFEYLVESRNATRSASQFGKFWNNLKVKTKLVFTRSPFWKAILNKRLKKCRPQSGDIVG